MKQYEYLKKIASNYKINVKLKDNRKIILKERNLLKKEQKIKDFYESRKP